MMIFRFHDLIKPNPREIPSIFMKIRLTSMHRTFYNPDSVSSPTHLHFYNKNTLYKLYVNHLSDIQIIRFLLRFITVSILRLKW